MKKKQAAKPVKVKPATDKETHGAKWFECQSCGKRWRMWLEKGVDDERFRRIYPEQHKTAPDKIKCLCGGTAEHVNLEGDLAFSSYKPIMPHMNYFSRSETEDYAIPVIIRL